MVSVCNYSLMASKSILRMICDLSLYHQRVALQVTITINCLYLFSTDLHSVKTPITTKQSLRFSVLISWMCKMKMYLQFMSMCYLHRMTSTHALCVPADVQEVNSKALTPSLRLQPRPDLSATVILRNNMCDAFTVEKQQIKSRMTHTLWIL